MNAIISIANYLIPLENNIRIFVACAYAISAIVMEIIICNLALIYTPTDEQAIYIVMMDIIIFND